MESKALNDLCGYLEKVADSYKELAGIIKSKQPDITRLLSLRGELAENVKAAGKANEEILDDVKSTPSYHISSAIFLLSKAIKNEFHDKVIGLLMQAQDMLLHEMDGYVSTDMLPMVDHPFEHPCYGFDGNKVSIVCCDGVLAPECNKKANGMTWETCPQGKLFTPQNS